VKKRGKIYSYLKKLEFRKGKKGMAHVKQANKMPWHEIKINKNEWKIRNSKTNGKEKRKRVGKWET